MLPYLSPTSFNSFWENRDRFVKTYVLRMPRPKQTKPMAVGSAFDVFVKSAIQNIPLDSNFTQKEFAKSVDKEFWDWAWDRGLHVLDLYKRSGALGALRKEIEGS